MFAKNVIYNQLVLVSLHTGIPVIKALQTIVLSKMLVFQLCSIIDHHLYLDQWNEIRNPSIHPEPNTIDDIWIADGIKQHHAFLGKSWSQYIYRWSSTI